MDTEKTMPRSLRWFKPQIARWFSRFPGISRRRCGKEGSVGLPKEVWKKSILMGDKCQPLDFSGVIHYDGEGRRMVGPPQSPLRSPLPYFIEPGKRRDR
ncbi:hypothetical protein HPP92_021476 [Vanilla planifolia]|uniref:Uncharacterized protein n=1 Tax=Vanilla planifolia TaxID=51239 RepID=A0A835UJG8_VANPL|nr:hypothetical protein HPP92_021476 [Vanilla planifolia]